MFHCNSCLSNKSHRHPFTQLSLCSSKPLQIIFSDLWGPSPVLSLDKKLYYCIFVDQYTKYTWLYTLTKKSEVKDIFQKFHPMMEKHFDSKILSLYTDGGCEYKSLDSYLPLHDIQHLSTPPYTPQRVALAERRLRHIVKTARTLFMRRLSHSNSGLLRAITLSTSSIVFQPLTSIINSHSKNYLENHLFINPYNFLVVYVIHG